MQLSVILCKQKRAYGMRISVGSSVVCSSDLRMSDAPISRQRAELLARNMLSLEEMRCRASLTGVTLTQGEYDLYMDFVGQRSEGRRVGKESVSTLRSTGSPYR